MENLNNIESFGLGQSSEVSEEAQKKVQEDSKKAAATRKQIHQSQQDNAKKAKFIEKILENFFENTEVLAKVFDYIVNGEYEKLEEIFSPILNNKHMEISEYIKAISTKNLDTQDVNLVFSIIKTGKIGSIINKLDNKKKEEFLSSIQLELTSLIKD